MGWFRLFGNGKQAKPLAPPQEKTADRIAEMILALQRLTAAKLNAQAQKFGKKNTLVLFGALLLGFAAYLIYIIINALF
ncbi:MAG: hypothetical protein EOO09_22810 [Chitinophagaceae bacterium]|nr:MAG: hypothetical protein EOO09_22810 [Chitinophagaceae bacterium]